MSALLTEMGRRVVLVMFDCPFFYKFPEEQVGKDESLQVWLNDWRMNEGEMWLESGSNNQGKRAKRN